MSQQPPIPYTPRPAPTNGLGVAGFIVSLVGIFTVGVLCPVGLLLSFIALFRRPRGFAAAGFIVGLLGTAFLALWLAFFGFVTLSCLNFATPMVVTTQSVQRANGLIQANAAAQMKLPNEIDGNAVISGQRDGWGHPLHYRPTGPQSFEIRSAGADGVLGSADDDGETFTLGVR